MNHAEISSVPVMRTVYLVRFCKPGRTSQVKTFYQKPAAERRADKFRSHGASVAIYQADVGTWTEIAP